jgi:hypothetical protein
MKIAAAPLSGVLLAIMIFVFAPAYAEGLPTPVLADNCQRAFQQFSDMHFTPNKNIARIRNTDYSQTFAKPYLLRIKSRLVPVFPFRNGKSPDTLIVLIHRKPNSEKEKPVIDAICPDNTGHHFMYQKALNTLDFTSKNGELLTLLFRLDPAGLPNTSWMPKYNDSIWMVEITDPPPTLLPQPHFDDWCSGQHKDIHTSTTDMWFTMCPQDGTPRGYKYTIRMQVNNKLFLIDPQIINRPQ